MSSPEPASGRTALLVEDDALVAMVAEDYLMELGFSPVTAHDGAAALAAIEGAADHAVALVDVGLPDMRGDDLARRIRELKPHLPMLIASGYDQAELRAKFEGDARVDVLPKPYVIADLEAALKRLGVIIS